MQSRSTRTVFRSQSRMGEETEKLTEAECNIEIMKGYMGSGDIHDVWMAADSPLFPDREAMNMESHSFNFLHQFTLSEISFGRYIYSTMASFSPVSLSNSSTTQDGPSFRLFPNLPPELRCMIWEAALPEPRIVYLRHARLVASPSPLPGDIHDLQEAPEPDRRGFTSDCPIPVLLCVSREAYGVASKPYERAFGTEDAFPEV